jgi:hypothetical protein
MKTVNRKFTKQASKEDRFIISKLSDKSNISSYKKNMFLLGMNLGNLIVRKNPNVKYFYLVCTVEDADFLARGIIESLKLNDKLVNISCFWNSRETAGTIGRISPVIRKYVEPYNPPKGVPGTLIVVKSLISGACVVKTNIKEIISNVNPENIIIAAPIMHKDAKKKLEKEFDKDIVQRFKYYSFATDNEKSDEGLVLPGLGNVYKLLGLKDQKTKNRHTPLTVKERRSFYLSAN